MNTEIWSFHILFFCFGTFYTFHFTSFVPQSSKWYKWYDIIKATLWRNVTAVLNTNQMSVTFCNVGTDYKQNSRHHNNLFFLKPTFINSLSDYLFLVPPSLSFSFLTILYCFYLLSLICFHSFYCLFNIICWKHVCDAVIRPIKMILKLLFYGKKVAQYCFNYDILTLIKLYWSELSITWHENVSQDDIRACVGTNWRG